MFSSLPALLLSSPKHINSNGSLSGAFSVLLSASNIFSLSLFLCSSQMQYLSVISLVLWESLIGLCLCTYLSSPRVCGFLRHGERSREVWRWYIGGQQTRSGSTKIFDMPFIAFEALNNQLPTWERDFMWKSELLAFLKKSEGQHHRDLLVPYLLLLEQGRCSQVCFPDLDFISGWLETLGFGKP